jgi:hypothetical protein
LTAAAAEPEPSVPGDLLSPGFSTPEGGNGEAMPAGAARGAPVVKAAFGLVWSLVTALLLHMDPVVLVFSWTGRHRGATCEVENSAEDWGRTCKGLVCTLRKGSVVIYKGGVMFASNRCVLILNC